MFFVPAMFANFPSKTVKTFRHLAPIFLPNDVLFTVSAENSFFFGKIDKIDKIRCLLAMRISKNHE